MRDIVLKLYEVVRSLLVRVSSACGLRRRLLARASNGPVSLWVASFFVSSFDELVELECPWWTLESANCIDLILSHMHGANAFEWGSGTSTVWLARRCRSVVSIEHDRKWKAAVDRHLPNNASVHLVNPERFLKPSSIVSAKSGYRGLDFQRYVNAIDEIDVGFDKYDVIVVDGRCREACLAKACERLSPDGIIVFDNSNRRRYRAALIHAKREMHMSTTRGLTPASPWPTSTSILYRKDSEFHRTFTRGFG